MAGAADKSSLQAHNRRRHMSSLIIDNWIAGDTCKRRKLQRGAVEGC